MASTIGPRACAPLLCATRAAGVDGADDLGVVDPLEIDARDAEMAVAELALNDDQRYAFARQFDGVRLAELVRRKAPANAGCDRGVAQVGPAGGVGPVAPARRPVEDAEQRSDGQLGPQLKPWLEFFSAPRVHADLAAASALAAPDQHSTTAPIEIGLGERERLVNAQPGTPEDHD
jgi:hypothetical protein